ncbi:MAG: Dabb family protein [Boseongicola sp.]|nr:MAG: Dabb family protein [Boseongicola sp.]
MILHCVFCNFRDEAPMLERIAVLQELAEFSRTLDGVVAFEFGPNLDFELKSPEYSDGFVIRFADITAAETYAGHPTHQALGMRLVGLCKGGADGIMVYDLNV